ADPVGGPLPGQGANPGGDRALAGGVVGLAGIALDAAGAGEIENCPAVFLQVREGVHVAQEGAGGVDGHHLVPLGEADGLGLAARGYAGGVDQHIETAEPCHPLVDGGLDLRFLRHLGAAEVGAAAGGAGLAPRLVAAPASRLGAEAREGLHQRLPHATGAAGDDDALAADVGSAGWVHGALLAMSGRAAPVERIVDIDGGAGSPSPRDLADWQQWAESMQSVGPRG